MADNNTNNKGTSPARFPPSEHTPSQKTAFATAEASVYENFGPHFTLRDDQGDLLSSYGILSYTPETFLPNLKFAQALISLPYLQPNERELATLAVVSETRAAYVEDVHRNVGLAMGLSAAAVEDAVKGKSVEDSAALGALRQRERVVYEVALAMTRGFGRIEDGLFERAVGVLGRPGVSNVAQVVGAFLLGSVLGNVGESKAPES